MNAVPSLPSGSQSCRKLTGYLRTIVQSGARWVAEVADQIASGLRGRLGKLVPAVASVAIAAGCESSTSEANAPAALVREAEATQPRAVEEPTQPKELGKFSITFYYVIGEDEVLAKARAQAKKAALAKAAAANDNQAVTSTSQVDEGHAELAAITTPETTSIYTSTCEPIAEVTTDFARQLAIQGTGKLRDGRLLNVWGPCKCERSPCYKVTATKWGTAGNGRPLQPFRTVAVDPKIVKLGSLLYVPLLEGRQMPGRPPWGGYVHDGCVIADDVGGGIKGKQLDLFVGRRGWFLGMSGRRGSHAWAMGVPVFDGSKICERKGRKVARKTGSI